MAGAVRSERSPCPGGRPDRIVGGRRPRYHSHVSAGRLAGFLKARRERLQPGDVGLVVDSSTRRVAGLRREEVAVLAGISRDYYLRLEQGHDANPSDHVVDALARALRLDEVGTDFLRSLARPPAPRSPARSSDAVHARVLWLIDSWPLTAAIVHNRYMDVLAANELARAVNPNFRPGANSVLELFTDPAERELHPDWEWMAARSVALLRAMAGSPEDDRRLRALVAEGSSSSALFRRSWERHDVSRDHDGTYALRHPDVGELTVLALRVPLADTDGHSMLLLHAEPGTSSAVALSELAAGGSSRGSRGSRSGAALDPRGPAARPGGAPR
jgi:transcriptional regulator with XRE-family HTH domain